MSISSKPYWSNSQLLIGRIVNTMASVTSRAPTAVRRKPAEQRRAEIVSTAGGIALATGLDSLTLRRVADALGVFPGLVNHYFPSVDDLVSAAFAEAAGGELEAIFSAVGGDGSALTRMRALMAALVSDERDATSLLWLDAWNTSRYRPALRVEVSRQMIAWQDHVTALVQAGASDGAFQVEDAALTALRILAMVDGLSVQAAIRSSIDYSVVSDMVIANTERELGLDAGELRPPLSRAS
jgi:AcrR family transcriptional regulator